MTVDLSLSVCNEFFQRKKIRGVAERKRFGSGNGCKNNSNR